MNRTGAASPDYMGSGGVPVVRNLPKFPNNTELVMEQEHAEVRVRATSVDLPLLSFMVPR
jgi:hypothetical protein